MTAIDWKRRRQLVRATNLLIPVLRAISRKEWKATPAARILLEGLRRELSDKSEQDR